MGKSSTVNSLFATAVVQAVPFHMITYQTMQPQMVRKRAEGVTLNVIDTPGLVDSDSVSETVHLYTPFLFLSFRLGFETFSISVKKYARGCHDVCGPIGHDKT